MIVLLLSTASDYMRFALMLANNGEGNGVYLLSRKTVELMTSDHLGPVLSQGPNFAPGPGYGFGLTVAVRTQPGMSGYEGSVGEYNWGGAAGRLLGRSQREASADHADPGSRAAALLPLRLPRPRLPGDHRLNREQDASAVTRVSVRWSGAFMQIHEVTFKWSFGTADKAA